MAYTLATIRNKVVNNKLDDTTYEPGIVNDFINDAQRSIFNSYELPFTEKTFVGQLPLNEYIFEFPLDFQVEQSIVLRTPTGQNTDITDNYMPFREFNSRYPAPSLNLPGRPIVWTSYGGKLYFGQPTNIVYTLSLFYIKSPAELIADTQVPELPEAFSEVLVLGAYYRVLQRNEDYDLAAAVEREYEKELAKLVRRLGPRQRGTPHIMGQPMRMAGRRRL